MRTALDDGRLQVTAAVSLLKNSKLVNWVPPTTRFAPVPRADFESLCRDVDPVFGRLICWILFAAGAEFLAKGVCLVNGVEIRREQEVPVNPTAPILAWIPKFREDWKSAGTTMTTVFGTIGSLMISDKKVKVAVPLKRLCSKIGATADQENLLFAAYEFLRRATRNRDAHAYVPNTRDSQFWLVAELFADCFNVLTRWLPGGPSTLNRWRAEADSFISSL